MHIGIIQRSKLNQRSVLRLFLTPNKLWINGVWQKDGIFSRSKLYAVDNVIIQRCFLLQSVFHVCGQIQSRNVFKLGVYFFLRLIYFVIDHDKDGAKDFFQPAGGVFLEQFRHHMKGNEGQLLGIKKRIRQFKGKHLGAQIIAEDFKVHGQNKR